MMHMSVVRQSRAGQPEALARAPDSRLSGFARLLGNSAVGLSGSGSGYICATVAVTLGWSGVGAGVEDEPRFH